MKLNKLYSLRNEFTIIGVTGKSGGGSSEFSNLLSNNMLIKNAEHKIDTLNLKNADDLKFKICYKYLAHPGNFQEYFIIDYKSVLLFHIMYEAVHLGEISNNINDAIEQIFLIVNDNGNDKYNEGYKNRFDHSDDFEFLKTLLREMPEWYNFIFKIDQKLNVYLENNKSNERLFILFNIFQSKISTIFFTKLFENNPTKWSRLIHDIGNNLRSFGTVKNLGPHQKNNNNIYTVAVTINYLIKIIRHNNKKVNKPTKIVIDSLRNSLELMYFKEKFSAFYMVSVNKTEDKRKEYLLEKLKSRGNDDHFNQILKIGDTEYSCDDFKRGFLSSPDIENCIQKSEYHINFDNKSNALRNILKFLALIERPGIITPSNLERCMQIAYNAKLNSGCISRQVGAAITDKNFVIKSVGWNDVAKNQMPCNLRSADDLINGENTDHFSDFELNGKINDKEFKNYLKDDLSSSDLEGRTCSFCFKTHLNSYEGEKNQVHTRSLHAEENAMMQIAKYGGNGLEGGNLFTTASPCELCSKKAYQLGIKNIYYIDPYPGIATTHILKSGINSDGDPILHLFEGAVGRTFHKLYEQMLPIKDELSIIGDFKPKTPLNIKKKEMLKILNSIEDKEIKMKLNRYFEIVKEEDFIKEFEKMLSDKFLL